MGSRAAPRRGDRGSVLLRGTDDRRPRPTAAKYRRPLVKGLPRSRSRCPRGDRRGRGRRRPRGERDAARSGGPVRARPGLAGRPLTRFPDGSQPVHAVGDERVLKLFPGAAARDGEAEGRVLSHVQGACPYRLRERTTQAVRERLAVRPDVPAARPGTWPAPGPACRTPTVSGWSPRSVRPSPRSTVSIPVRSGSSSGRGLGRVRHQGVRRRLRPGGAARLHAAARVQHPPWDLRELGAPAEAWSGTA